MRSSLLHLRHLSTTSTSRTNPLRCVPYHQRSASLLLAQQTLSEYLHNTRSLPSSIADLIAHNCPLSLSSLVSSLPSSPSPSPSLLPSSLRRLLSFHPPDELSFFLESIGLSPSHPNPHPPFLSDSPTLLPVASSLLDFGFPWSKLGLLYLHSPVFSSPPSSLPRTLSRFASSSHPLPRACLVAACLAFPRLFHHPPEPHPDLLFSDLRSILGGGHHEPAGTVKENVDAFLTLCERVRAAYDLGCEKGHLGELGGDWWNAFLGLEKVHLEGTLRFLRTLGVEKEDATNLILKHPEALVLNVEHCEISMPEYLECVGFCGEELHAICGRHPYAMGRNKLANLPGCLRVLGYNKWLLNMVRSGDFRYLSAEFLKAARGGDEMEVEFREGLESVKAARMESLLPTKMEFLQEIGFGRNGFMIRALRLVNGSGDDLRERFDCLLDMGIEYSDLCKMISASPKLLNHKPDVLRRKVDFLCNELGLTVEYLYDSPTYLCFDLENRIKPRYRMLDWLRSKGLLAKWFSPSTVISTSEKKYIAYLKEGHPAAPKLWLEVFKFNNHNDFYMGSF